MATPKEDINSTKAEPTPDIRRVTHNKEGRNERQNLLLSTTYGLNISSTKKIHVGLRLKKEGGYIPCVKLTGNYTDGICFDVDSWKLFQEKMEYMMAYLNGDYYQTGQERIVICDKIYVNFTTAYGVRAILLTNKEDEDQATKNIVKNTLVPPKFEVQEGKDEEIQPTPTKKRRIHSVAIVMQKPTFLGLENIIGCVNAHLDRMKDSVADIVNECATYLLTEIELNLPNKYVDSDIIKLTLRANYKNIARDVRTQISNLLFLDVYFEIAFQEMITFHLNEIVRMILEKREKKIEELKFLNSIL